MPCVKPSSAWYGTSRASTRGVGNYALRRIKRILVPVDFSRYTDSVLVSAAFLASNHAASVDLLHVWREPFALPAPWNEAPKAPAKARRELISLYEVALDRAAEQLADLGAQSVSVHLVEGTASHSILELLDDESFDLVVMGNHGQTGLPQAYIGSVTERVIRRSTVPVLVVPSPLSGEAD